MESHDPSFSSDIPEISLRRRAIFERTVSKYAAAGIALDDHEYLSLIDRWIKGELTMPAAAAIWDGIRQQRVRNA
jgi:hypothetical protein